MRVGTVKEIKNHEYRVGLTPESARELVVHGHEVWVESGAGNGIGATDRDYENAGAAIKSDAATIFSECEMVVKVKEPQKVEWERLEPRHILFTYLHLAPDPAQTEGLVTSGCAAIAYETVQLEDGSLPLLTPMSEVAGRLAPQVGAHYLERTAGGRGVLLGGVPGVPPAEVIVLGGGVLAGLISGAVSQHLFALGANSFAAQLSETEAERVLPLIIKSGQVVGWSLLGALLGFGLAFFIPNLPKFRAGFAGLIGAGRSEHDRQNAGATAQPARHAEAGYPGSKHGHAHRHPGGSGRDHSHGARRRHSLFRGRRQVRARDHCRT